MSSDADQQARKNLWRLAVDAWKAGAYETQSFDNVLNAVLADLPTVLRAATPEQVAEALAEAGWTVETESDQRVDLDGRPLAPPVERYVAVSGWLAVSGWKPVTG